MSDYPSEPTGPIDDRSERRERRRHRRGSAGVLFAIALIVLGAATLMNNLGIAAVNWNEAVRYWPVLLILFGLDMMIGRQTAIGSFVMALVTVAALLGVFWLAGTVPPAPAEQPQTLFSPGKQVDGTISEDLQGAKKLEVNVELSQMALTLGAQKGGQLAAQGDWTTVERLRPDISYEVEDGVGKLTITQPDNNDLSSLGIDSKMTLNLPAGIPIELTTRDSQGAVSMDLSGLGVTLLDSNGSAGNMDITLPETGQLSEASAHTDLGALSVKALGTSTLNIDTVDFSTSSGNLTVVLPPRGTISDITLHSDLGALDVTIPDDATLQLGTVDYGSSSGNVTVALPSQGKAGEVTIKASLGAITLTIPGKVNQLSLDQLNIDSSNGNLTAVLPGAGNYQANFQVDLGSLTVSLPASLEAHVSIDTGLTRPTVSSPRLKSFGDTDWETAGYSTSDNRALVTLNASAGNVEVKDQ